MLAYRPTKHDHEASGLIFQVEVDDQPVIMQQERISKDHLKVTFNKSMVASLLILLVLAVHPPNDSYSPGAPNRTVSSSWGRRGGFCLR